MDDLDTSIMVKLETAAMPVAVHLTFAVAGAKLAEGQTATANVFPGGSVPVG
jgi:hypothetical protein